MSNGLFGRLYRGETSFDFFGRRRIGFALSTLLIVLTVVSLLGRGLNLGIDFEGGVAWQVPASEGFGVSRPATPRSRPSPVARASSFAFKWATNRSRFAKRCKKRWPRPPESSRVRFR
jgi:preprotein translocase subunit SecF